MSASRYVIEVETEHVSGKFAGVDDIEEKIGDALDEVESSIDLSGLGPDGDSEYEVSGFTVEAVDVCDAHRKDRRGRCVLAPHHAGDHVDRTGVARWANRGRQAYGS